VRDANAANLLPSILLIVVLTPQTIAAGEPYTPSDPDLIVERLPRMPLRPSTSDRLGASVASVRQARADALAYLALAQRSGDARYLGYAQGVLLPWRDAEPLPTELLLPKAMVEQARHDFTAALQTLDRLLSQEPGNAQAWLTRSVILQVTGRPDAARASCRRLTGHVSLLIRTACAAGAARLTGEVSEAYRSLLGAIGNATAADGSDGITWALMVLSDVAEASGDRETAGESLHQAVQRAPEDVRPRIAYADFLLRQGNAVEVLELIPHDTIAPMLVMRRALAAKRLGHPTLNDLSARLQAHFRAAEQRGDELHRREAGLANLRLFGQPDRALSLAQRNWQSQREFADAHLLLAAALANQDRQAAQPVLQWLRRQQTADARLLELVEALERREARDGA
jgi:hypothetical protein